jgi:hypothetical protein
LIAACALDVLALFRLNRERWNRREHGAQNYQYNQENQHDREDRRKHYLVSVHRNFD